MDWRIDEAAAGLKVTVEGRFVAADAPLLKEQVLAAMRDGEVVTFDLSGVPHIDSSGVGTLAQVLQRARKGGGRVILDGVRPGPKAVLDLTKASRLFEVRPLR